MCPRQESDLDCRLRKLAFYPLNYGDPKSLSLLNHNLSNLVNCSEAGGTVLSKSSSKYRNK